MTDHPLMTERLVFEFLKTSGCMVDPCGSRVTCSPPPADTDRDFLVMIPQEYDVAHVITVLSDAGFAWEGSEHYRDAAGSFMSWRRDDLNLIVTSNAEFATRHRAATGVCKRLNLLDKGDRVALFQAVLYGTLVGEALPVGAKP